MSILTFIFPPCGRQNKTASIALLVMRVAFGLLLMTHGWMKLSNFSEMSGQFMSFLGMGGGVSLGLAIFAEFFCSIAVIFGFLTRFACIPILITFLVAFFGAHGGSLSGEHSGELALVYLLAYLAIFLAGAGNYSLDNVLSRKTGK